MATNTTTLVYATPQSVVSINGYTFSTFDGFTWTNAGGMTSTGNDAWFATTIISVHFPTTLVTIGNSAFVSCSRLTTITVDSPSSLTTIGDSAFELSTLTTFTIGSSNLTTIGSFAFNNCSLSSFNIPTTVTSIGDNAFRGNTRKPLSGGITFDSPSSLTTFSNNTFKNCALTTIQIPDSITSIGISAFEQCVSLTSVTFGMSSLLNTINDLAFSGTGLLNIIVPSTVINVGSRAFNTTSLGWVENSTLTFPPYVSSPLAGWSPTAFNVGFNNVSKTAYTSSSGNGIYLYMQTNYPNTTLIIGPSCYHENTNILTETGYIPIKDIKTGTSIKTLNDGYKKVIHTHFQPFISNHKSFPTTMYELQTNNEFDNLRITGNHCILLDEPQTHMKPIIKGNIDEWMIDGKYISVAGYDPKFTSLPEGVYNVYHIVLENDDAKRRYAIYANGMLSETMSEGHYLEEIRNKK